MSRLGARLGASNQVAGLRETWIRLNRIDLSSRAVVVSLLIAHLLTTFTFEIGRIGENPVMVLVVALIAEVFFWAFFMAMVALHAAFSTPKTSAIINLLILFLSNTLRVYFLEYGYLQFGLLDQVTIGARILGDSTGIILIMVGVAYIQVVLTELAQQETDLQIASRELAEMGRVSRTNAQAADLQLRTKARLELGAQLSAIISHLEAAKPGQASKLAQEIRELIEFKVRPLSAELWRQLESIESVQDQTPPVKKRRFPRRIFPGADFRGPVAFAYGGLNIFVTAPGLSNWNLALVFGLVTLTFPFLGELLARIYPREKGHSLVPGLTVVSLLAMLAWSPSITFLLWESRNFPNLALLALTSSLVIWVGAVGVALWSAFKRERTDYLEKVEVLNREKSRRLALLDQEVWVARRRWSYLIHGTVQGALTVALARLQLSKSLTPELRSQALDDIERAKQALEGEARFEQDWKDVLPEIRQTWDQVCELKFDVAIDAQKRLEENASTSVCVAEITKELVGNAFRHGKASEVNVKLVLDEIGDIKLSAINNGEPIAKTRLSGVGSAMFDELTTSWSFRNTASGPKFRATIPVPN